ncbi:MAG: hypothetical protein K6F50_07160 [Kiritimatiellae bacterium]|nr:hypothetical protein [Kiritimatiellia bacterium]
MNSKTVRPFVTPAIAAAAAIFGFSAKAATPTAVWEGTISGTTNGYTIVEATDSTLGSTIDLTAADTQKVSVLIKYSGLSAQSSGYYTLASVKETRGYTIGARNSSVGGLSLTGYFAANSLNGYAFSTTPTLPASGYFLFTYADEVANNSGTAAYAGSSVAAMTGGLNTSLRWTHASYRITTLSIGGPVEVNSTTSVSAWPGVTIDAVALFVGEILTPSDVADYQFPSEVTGDEYTATADSNMNWDDLIWNKTLPADLSSSTVRVTVEDGVTLTMPDSLSGIGNLYITGGTLTFGSTSALTMDGGAITSAMTVPASTTVVLDGATISGAVTVNGTLQTKGTTMLSSSSNTVPSGGTLEVVSGTTTFNAASQGIAGTLTIDAGATYVNALTADALTYSGSPTVNVYGTLSMDTTRWTVGSGTYNFYTGSVISGSGQGDNGALDTMDGVTPTYNFLKSGTAEGTVTLSAALRIRDGLTLNVAEGVTVDCTSVTKAYGYTASAPVTKSGAGTLKLSSGANILARNPLTVSAGTLDLAGGTVASLTMTGTAALAVTSGSYQPTFSSYTGAITVASGATLTMTSAEQAAAGSITVAEGGTLKIILTAAELASGYTAENVTLDGASDNITFLDEGGTEYSGSGKTIGAQGNFWIGGESGTWATDSNWSYGTAPTSSTIASITNAATITVTATDVAGAVTVNEDVTLTGVSGSTTAATSLGLVTIADGKTLTFEATGDSYFWGVAGGTLVKTGSGTLNIVNSTSTSYAVAGTTVQVNEGTLCIHNANQDCYMSDPTFIVGENGTLDNLGYFTVTGTLTIESDYEKTVFKNSDYAVSGVITHARVRGTPTLVKNGTGDVTFMMGTQNGSLSAVTVNGGTLNMGSKQSATISGAVTGEGVFGVTGTGEVILTAPNQFAISTVSGTGTIVSSTIYPGSGTLLTCFQNSTDWTGSFCLRNISSSKGNINFNVFGNTNSTVIVQGLTGHIINGTVTCLPKVVLTDYGTTGALTLSDGYSGSEYIINELSGTGTITDNTGSTQIFRILASSNYTGSVSLTGKRVVFGTDAIVHGSAPSFTVSTNATAYLASGATWTGGNGLYVAGTLVNNGGTLPASVAFADGATLDFGTAGTALSVADKTLTLGSTLTVVGDGLKNGSAIFTGLTAEPSTLPRVTVGDTTYRTVYSDGSVLLKFVGFSISIQ